METCMQSEIHNKNKTANKPFLTRWNWLYRPTDTIIFYHKTCVEWEHNTGDNDKESKMTVIWFLN